MRIKSLLQAYKEGRTTPREVMREVRERIRAHEENPLFIHLLSEAELEPYLSALERSEAKNLPLFGIPFAIKDNIDLAGIPTTAACPKYAYVPECSAFVVQRLIEAGAIPVGKSNLDQFATGLVGTRSPYGACRNSIDPEYISGGSSSGSAVSVALEMVSFSLGTDTAGSGRVPAALNAILGLKPTKGWLSTLGVVPACRSLDCVSIFAKEGEEVRMILEVAGIYDESDPYAREERSVAPLALNPKIAVLLKAQREFLGDSEYERLFEEAIERFRALGARVEEVDISPLILAAKLLYEGPWVSERYVAIQEFLENQPEALLEVTRGIIQGGASKSAADYFKAEYRLMECKREAQKRLQGFDFSLLPTIPRPYTIKEVEADPVRLNSHLGHYTNFMNLLDLAAYAIPAGFRQDGIPFGITLFSEPFSESRLIEAGEYFLKGVR